MSKEYHVLGPGSDGLEKRIFQLVCCVGYLKAEYRGTWCELFKTKGYRKSQYVFEHGCKRVGQLIKKQYGNDVVHWELCGIYPGSKKRIDVQCIRNQRFLLEIKRG